jgi:ABC-type glycerol-3-phosphate transport system substrate-binding protein
MKQKLWKIVSIPGLLFLALAFTACGNKGSETEVSASDGELSGTITFLSIAEYNNGNVQAVEAFEAEYPDINVELEEYPFTQLFDVIEIKLGSQSSNFDVVLTDATMVSGYAYRGFIAPLDDYYTEEEKAVFAPALVDSGSCQGSFYTPPIKNSSHVLFYNKDLLDAAGLEYPSVDPEERLTWDEIVEMSEAIMAASSDPTVYGLTFEQISRPYQILPLVNSAEGEGIGPDGMEVEGYVNGPGFTRAMQWYSDIHNTYGIAPKGVAPSETIGLFTAGKIAFICANIFDYRTFEATEGLRYGFAPFPSFADGVPATPTDSFHIGVSNFSENKAAAAEFVKFFTSGKGNDAFCSARGEFSARVGELQKYFDDPQYDEEPLSIFRLAAYEAQNTAAPRPKSLGYREWESVIGATIEDIRNGADVEKALDAAVSSIEVKLAPYR